MSEINCLCNKKSKENSLEDSTPILICEDKKCNFIQYLKTTNILEMNYDTEDSENDSDYDLEEESDCDDDYEISRLEEIDDEEISQLQEDANDFIKG